MGTFSIGHWLIILLVVVLVFGTKKLGNIGADLGKGVKGFKDGLKGEAGDPQQAVLLPEAVNDPVHAAINGKDKTTV